MPSAIMFAVVSCPAAMSVRPMAASARWVSAPVATWDKLSDGGSVSVPLEKLMRGDVFGMCTDKFGITWMVGIGEQQI